MEKISFGQNLKPPSHFLCINLTLLNGPELYVWPVMAVVISTEYMPAGYERDLKL